MSIATKIATDYSREQFSSPQRVNACAALGLLDDDESLARLGELCSDKDDKVRRAAANAVKSRILRLGGDQSNEERRKAAVTWRESSASQFPPAERFRMLWPEF